MVGRYTCVDEVFCTRAKRSSSSISSSCLPVSVTGAPSVSAHHLADGCCCYGVIAGDHDHPYAGLLCTPGLPLWPPASGGRSFPGDPAKDKSVPNARRRAFRPRSVRASSVCHAQNPQSILCKPLRHIQHFVLSKGFTCCRHGNTCRVPVPTPLSERPLPCCRACEGSP